MDEPMKRMIGTGHRLRNQEADFNKQTATKYQSNLKFLER
jgi:hypothetical protein